jgi:hypothetical protein
MPRRTHFQSVPRRACRRMLLTYECRKQALDDLPPAIVFPVRELTFCWMHELRRIQLDIVVNTYQQCRRRNVAALYYRQSWAFHQV